MKNFTLNLAVLALSLFAFGPLSAQGPCPQSATIGWSENSGEQPDDGILCSGDEIQLTALVFPFSSNHQFVWYDPGFDLLSTSRSFSFVPTVSGTYHLYAYRNDCQEYAYAAVTISVGPCCPEEVIATNNVYHPEGNCEAYVSLMADVEGDPDGSYTWTRDGQFYASYRWIDVSEPAGTTEWCVTFTPADGCPPLSDCTTVTVEEPEVTDPTLTTIVDCFSDGYVQHSDACTPPVHPFDDSEFVLVFTVCAGQGNSVTGILPFLNATQIGDIRCDGVVNDQFNPVSFTGCRTFSITADNDLANFGINFDLRVDFTNCNESFSRYNGGHVLDLDCDGNPGAEASAPTAARKERPAKSAPTAPAALTVYPNPADQELNLSLPAALGEQLTALSLHDLSGRTVLSRSARGGQLTQRLDVGQLPDGMYLLRLSGADGPLASRKVVVRH